MSFAPISRAVAGRAVGKGVDALEFWANRETQPLLAELRGYANRPDAVNATLTGADNTGVRDSFAGIMAAFAASTHVFLPAGTYRVETPISIPDGGLLYGAGVGADGTIIHSATGNAVTSVDVSNWCIRDLSITADAGNGIYCFVSTGIGSLYNTVSNVAITAPAGKCIHLDAEGNGAHIYPTFADVSLIGGGGGASVGLKANGDNVDPTAINCVGARFLNGRVSACKIGFDFDQLGEFTVMGTRLSSFVAAGTGVRVGNCANVLLQYPRFEDIATFVEFLGVTTRQPVVMLAQDLVGTKILDHGAAQPTLLIRGDQCGTEFGHRIHYLRLVAAGSWETRGSGVTLAAGANVLVATDTPLVKVSGPAGPFSISSLAVTATTDATQAIDGRRITLYNTTAQPMTITNLAVGSGAAGITTLTGGDVLAGGPAVVDFFYDTSIPGWVLG